MSIVPSDPRAATIIAEHEALAGTPDPNWPDPAADGFVWEHVELACDSCGAANQIHRQRPEDLAQPAGVKWECTACGAANRVGGFTAAPPAGYVLECANCSATHDPNTISQADDGTWTCPTCDTQQRHVMLGESGSGSTEAKA